MAYHPPTCLVLERVVLLVSGPHFHVLNPNTGDLLQSTTTFADDAADKLRKSGPVRCIAVDADGVHIATTGDDKNLKVWSLADGLQLVSERELPKKPTEVSFTRDGQTIVISDKFGDVFSYPLHPDSLPASTSQTAGASKRGSLTSHENPSNGTLILGHASMLTTFLLSPDERYVITADRDEHIRVSWYPQGYAIERYCLGHEKFVSALHIPSFQPSTLISGGGDPMLKVWDWMSGKLLANITVFPAVEPYIKVKAPKRRRGSDGDGDGVNGEQKKGKGRRHRGKGKGMGKEEAREGSADVEQVEGAAAPKANETPEDSSMPDPGSGDAQNISAAPEEVVVFVVHKISSADRGEHGRFIIFNAVGATALFYTPLPAEGTTDASVHAVDFGVPVIDFTVGPKGDVWVLLDAEWSGTQSSSSSEKPQFVRMLTWDGATVSRARSRTGDVPLLASLNAKCLVSATAEDLKTLDLYSDLSSMPKNVDPEHDPLIRDTLSEAAAIDPETDGKELTQRELGRLRKKKALLAKIQEKEQQKRGASEVAETESGRAVKRTRSESGDADGKEKEKEKNVMSEDVEMK
ncbi:WD40 repeat-like protein [Polyporus arcularius HHB13444]|uniref:WD40 repeat-like protein n=1 Tax=Polyporus arcularius HHB13444 TaxID=1314778 RepID=A0A5C3P2B1_9APHY|nr:WD40 repeat-like protein [Polyporus arcularius HHB13444]